MPKPYSIDLRKRVIQKHEEGKSVSEIERELNVKTTFVYDMPGLHKTTGSVEAKPAAGGRKPGITDGVLSQMEALILETPDMTLQEIKDRLGLTVSLSVICDAINKKLNLRYKKKRFSTRGKTMTMHGKRVKAGQTAKAKCPPQASCSLMKAV
jgi:transposase